MKEVTCVLEDNEIHMSIDSWGSRGTQIKSKYHLLVIYDMIGQTEFER